MPVIDVKPTSEADREWMRDLWQAVWGGDFMVINGEEITLSTLEGLAAYKQNRAAGLLTFRMLGDECEVVSLDALEPGRGIGSQLLLAAQELARRRGCRLIKLTTTNDNIDALRFYQKLGFRLSALRVGAVDKARTIKPGIPLIGSSGIPVHDEIELEKKL